jgi:hypothetical protein
MRQTFIGSFDPEDEASEKVYSQKIIPKISRNPYSMIYKQSIII